MVRDLAVLESLNQQVLDALPSGILFCDTDYIVRRVNACYAALLGGKVSSILGRPLTELNPATRAPIVIKNGKPELGDLCTLPLFGDNYKFVVNRVPVRDNQGDVIGMVSHILFTDPNELKELHDKIDLLQKKKRIYNKSNNSSCTRYNVDSIVGESRKIVEIKRQIKIYAADSHPVLIRGNTGTGKELVAQALHSGSTYASGKFVSINCAAVPTELFEAELFGYAPGAFSGAHKSGKMGLLELANGGTLFLDEIGDLDPSCQVKLLRVLQDQTFEVLGDSRPRKVDIRVVSATNRNLREMVAERTFREDLFYRINLITVHLPALRERKDDIPLLARYFADKQSEMNGLPAVRFSSEALNFLQKLPYPGNIRELKNLVERTMLVSGKAVLEASDFESQCLHTTLSAKVEAVPSLDGLTLDELEKQTILQALKTHAGNLSHVATALGISRAALYRRLEKYDIPVDK